MSLLDGWEVPRKLCDVCHKPLNEHWRSRPCLAVKWWVSCTKFTGQVDTGKDDIILMAPPVWKKFVGQPFIHLLNWLRKFGGLKYENL